MSMPRGKFYDLAPVPLDNGYFVFGRAAEDGSGVITEVRDRQGRVRYGGGNEIRRRSCPRVTLGAETSLFIRA
jgi:hypothetical protein